MILARRQRGKGGTSAAVRRRRIAVAPLGASAPIAMLDNELLMLGDRTFECALREG